MNTTTNAAATILDLDAMLDVSMDSVENVPDYQNPPAGNYLLAVKDAKTEKKDSKKEETKGQQYAIIKITYEVKSTLELAPNSTDLPVQDGTLFTEQFQVTEDGLKYFKKQAMKILNVKDVAGASLRDLVSGLAGAECHATISIRKSTVNGKEYENLQVRPFHMTPAA